MAFVVNSHKGRPWIDPCLVHCFPISFSGNMAFCMQERQVTRLESSRAYEDSHSRVSLAAGQSDAVEMTGSHDSRCGCGDKSREANGAAGPSASVPCYGAKIIVQSLNFGSGLLASRVVCIVVSIEEKLQQ